MSSFEQLTNLLKIMIEGYWDIFVNNKDSASGFFLSIQLVLTS